MSKQRIPPSPHQPTPHFKNKYFIPTLIAKLEEVSPPFIKGRFELFILVENLHETSVVAQRQVYDGI